MADGIRLDLQEALARGPSGIPNLEPLFAPGAIPPVFDEAPEVEEGPGFIPGGGIPGVSTGTFTGEPIDIGSGSIGQPVPPVKESRGDRLRALLGNFLQNFGTGLQAASRAPSGAEFAAGFGGALSAGEERRQQKSREELLRANQAFREQFARERAELDAERFEFTQQQAEAARIERNLDRAERGREREEGRRARGFRDVLETNRARRRRAGEREFRREERKGRETFQERLQRKQQQFQREQETTKAKGKLALSVKDAFSLAFQEVRVGLSAEDPLGKERTFKNATEAISFARKRAIAIFRDANGIGPSKEELAAAIPRAEKVEEFVKEFQSLAVSDDEIILTLRTAREQGEISDEEAEVIGQQVGLVTSGGKRALEQLKERLKPTRFQELLKRGGRLLTPAIEAIQGKRPFIGEPESNR